MKSLSVVKGGDFFSLEYTLKPAFNQKINETCRMMMTKTESLTSDTNGSVGLQHFSCLSEV